ncbi:MAG: Rrf2 family transcriptional regulator [Candidatus Magasanikbacteria bacterium]|jgi:Rrf2 family protein|nr:Rrf2 family transcriptional regulator [Candidatus Magasanikbacteria bacterium]MBT4071723.1 Rrf2 family transcriptional regulator [Candidatus Magasanikbacteria bacterium]
MISLNKQVDYGVQFLITLSQLEEKQQISLRTFTNEHNMSFLFLQRIAALLKGAGLITATKGAHGGYTLAKKAEDITFLDIYEAIEGAYGAATCLKKGCSCPREQACDSRMFFSVLQKDLRVFMKGYTLADMADLSRA